MMIQFDVCEAPDGFSYRRAHSEIRHKMAIHDVDVDHADADLLDAPDLLPQPYEVRREYGWKNLHSP